MTVIAKDKAVSLRYTLRNRAGKELDRSTEDKPLWYLHGHRNIVPGLERGLEGKEEGADLTVEVPPAEGYGEKSKVKLLELRRSAFPPHADVKRGDNFMLQGPKGPFPVWVKKIQGPTVHVTPLHPLAGETLCFEVQVLQVRDATAEELAHGHVHGPGAHDHGAHDSSDAATEEESSAGEASEE